MEPIKIQTLNKYLDRHFNDVITVCVCGGGGGGSKNVY